MENKENIAVLLHHIKKMLIIILLVFVNTPFTYADALEKKVIEKKKGWAFTNEEEFRAMPEYCRARFYPQDSSFYKKWRKIIGPGFIDIHHY